MAIANAAAIASSRRVNVVRAMASETRSFSGIVRYTASEGTAARTAFRAPDAISDASPLARTTNATSRGVQGWPFAALVTSWLYTTAAGARANPSSCVLPTTPTIVDHGSVNVMRTRLPTAVAAVQYRLANASLTTTSR